ncbi:cytosolic protein [Candidatus Poribacteria bacterium]|nr:cytosolic protein [Candidatus Poribacteria bacterium]
MTEPNRYWAYFDEAWKKVIERFFPQFLQFFVPELYEMVDFNKPFTFLDKEMEQLAQKSLKGSKFVDKLVKVFLKDGSEEWILVHVEVQGDEDEAFSLRMFRYFYRIFDQHGKRIVSLAILASSEIESATGRYALLAFNSGVEFRYLTRQLMDYERDKLEADENPIALVVLAAQERERFRRRRRGRFNAKLYLIRKLYERGYNREEIIGLFEFIDWVIQLNDEEEDKHFWEEVKTLEEVRKMPYVTTGERIGMTTGERIGMEKGLKQGLEQGLEQGVQQGLEQGVQQGRQRMVIEELTERFGEIPSPISSTIYQIEDLHRLRVLMRHAVISESLEEFLGALNGGNS